MPLHLPGGDDVFSRRDGVFVPRAGGVGHHVLEYDARGFAVLQRIQERHFWYRARHRFIRGALLRSLARTYAAAGDASAIDVGGGCGGWVKFLHRKGPRFRELAVANSSLAALKVARTVVPQSVECYNVSLHELPWRSRWDVVFALDVLEHLDDDADALRRLAAIIKPGGLIVATVPALMSFWSVKDEIAHHRRRYSVADLRELGDRTGLQVLDSRYFMFMLSPALWALKAGQHGTHTETDAERRRLADRIHAIPPSAVNWALSCILGAETPLGLHVRFPWGTSALAIYWSPVA